MEIRKLAPGDRVLDYRILERLGEGGFGEVFRAEHEVLGRVVAIKVPRDQGSLTALRHEGVVQATLEHPSVVRTLELSISHDPPYVVMEFVDGRSLAQLLKRGPLPLKEGVRILLEAARALAYAHSRGVVHGDVKPGNLLVEHQQPGRVLLTDFGLGRVFEGPQGSLQISRSLELATSGAEVQGTIRYLAPELLRGEQADERADLFSFGVLLFEVLTGRLPEGREVPSDLNGEVPPALDQVFEQLFTRKERRPKSFSSTIEALEAVLAPPAPAPATPEVVRAIPAALTAAPPAPASPGTLQPSSARHAEAPTSSAAMRELRGTPVFARWREALLTRVEQRMGELRGLSVGDGRGYDRCFGVDSDGEPHHRVYALVVPELDASGARTAVAEARRIFDLEKGIWEKEVTFWIVAREVREHEQVLWALKSFAMGWWRRRRVVLQDMGGERLYATELGCDPRGNPLKRAFLTAATASAREVPLEEPEPASAAPTARRRCHARGTAWGAALALLMTFGLLGSVMAVELANRKVRRRARGHAPAAVHHHPETRGPALLLGPSGRLEAPQPKVPEPLPDAFSPDEDLPAHH